MVCWRDRSGEDQVGSPSPAGPSILEPVRGRGAERVVPPAALQPTPRCLDIPQQDVPHLLLPPGHPLCERSGEADALHRSSNSLSQLVPSCPCWGIRTPPSACPTTLLWPHSSQGGPQTWEEGRSPPRDFTPALFLAPCHPTGKRKERRLPMG